MIGDSLSTGEKRVLMVLSEESGLSPVSIMEKGDFEQLVEVMNAVSWLQSKGLVVLEEAIVHKVALDAEGRLYIDKGFPERRVLEMLLASGEGTVPLEKVRGFFGKAMTGITIGWLKRKKWAGMDRSGPGPALRITIVGRKAQDERTPDEEVLHFINEMGEVELDDIADKEALALLRSRKSVIKVKDQVVKTVTITEKGKAVIDSGIEIKDQVTQLRPSMLKDGAWKGLSFRPYDVDSFAPRAKGGKKNPLKMITDEIRGIFFNMGFTEVEYDFIQPCFWNMDALFIPQDHAARDLQDTFFMKDPERIPIDDRTSERIRRVHEDGGDTGSSGWQYKWSKDDAQKVVLRTHTTVNSIRYLAAHPDPPVKIFTVGRVFRNESVTFKHLPEFQQIEGIVMEEKASFRMLLGLLRVFYHRMGFEDIRIRPSFFPYTEPSLEVDAKFKGEWMEMGGSGILRPEVTEPFGIRHPVLAWGLGLERLMMIRFGIDDIRSIYVNDLDWLQKAPLL